MAASDYASKAINPQSYYVRRPYMPRYGYGGYGYRSPTAGAFEGGYQFGNELMQGIANIVAVKQQQAAQARADAIANQIMNTQNAPRAALAGQGTLSNADWLKLRQSNVPFTGSAPATGGLAQLQLQNAQNQQDLADALKRAQIANQLAQVTGTGRYAKAPPGLTPYQQKQVEWHQQDQEQKQQAAREKQFQSWQEKNALDAPKLAQSFEKTYGKGSAEQFYNAASAGTGVRGNIVNGQFIPDDNGEYFSYDADTARGTPGQAGGLFGMGAVSAKPATVADLKGSLIKYNELQSYLDKAKQIEDAGGKLYPTQYPKELYGPAQRAQPVGTAPPAAGQPVDQATTLADQANPFAAGGSLYNWSMDGQATDQTSGQRSGQADTSSLPTPSTQDEYDAIPSGSQFIDGDSVIKIKP